MKWSRARQRITIPARRKYAEDEFDRADTLSYESSSEEEEAAIESTIAKIETPQPQSGFESQYNYDCDDYEGIWWFRPLFKTSRIFQRLTLSDLTLSEEQPQSDVESHDSYDCDESKGTWWFRRFFKMPKIPNRLKRYVHEYNKRKALEQDSDEATQPASDDNGTEEDCRCSPFLCFKNLNL